MKLRIDQLLLAISLTLIGSAVTPVMAADTATAPEASGQDLTQPRGLTPEIDDYAPMTRSERFRKYLTSTFGPKAINKATAAAEIDQLRHVPHEWGKNPAGFGTRFGSVFAQHFVRGTLQYGASAILHEDNRYVRSGKHGFWKRTGYAISSTFLARRDDGRRRFAFSRIGSAGGATAISRAWLPSSLVTAGSAAGSFGTLIALDAGSNVFREFWPDLKRGFRRN
jgi:hypothetical protein